MPYPTHFRFVWRGVFKDTPEIWSFSAHFSRVNPGEVDAGLDDITESGVTSATAAFFDTGVMDSGVLLTDWRAYVIGTDGRMEGNGPLLHDATGDAIDGSGGRIYPPQVAQCVTLVAADRGPAKFGRFFLPGPALALGTDRRYTDTQCGIVSSVVTTFLKDVSDAIDLEALNQSACVNVSNRPAGGAGTIQEVDHVEVGRALDTIRTRRNQLLEERHVGGHIDW
jgi:hypothetical protein